jgi:hypothetical protein
MTGTRLELPEVPKGFTRKMIAHYNFGHGKKGGGAATFEIFDASGNKMPFGWQYDTTPDGLTGFTVAGVNGVFESWAKLRQYYLVDPPP